MKKKILKFVKAILVLLLLFVVVRVFCPTWTPSIKTENGISELTKVDINGASLEVMIRGNDKSNLYTSCKKTAVRHRCLTAVYFYIFVDHMLQSSTLVAKSS